MIIRTNDGGLLLIPQTEHSMFVGQLAAHWGNDRFAAPKPFESVARAAAYHDFGYLDWEPDVPFDPETGGPYEFRKLPTRERQLLAYQRCIDWMTDIDRYSGLLVSMHRTGLWRGRYGTIEYPSMNARSLHSDVESFIARNETWQAGEKSHLDADEVKVNFHLLQVWDLLGLYFGCQEPGSDHVEPVPTGYGKDSERVTLKMRNVGGRKVAFDPYPFDQEGIKVQMRGKRLRQAKFADEASFRAAYYKAGNEVLEYELCADR